jgi:hypothetical protein
MSERAERIATAVKALLAVPKAHGLSQYEASIAMGMAAPYFALEGHGRHDALFAALLVLSHDRN